METRSSQPRQDTCSETLAGGLRAQPLAAPGVLRQQLRLGDEDAARVKRYRKEVVDILTGKNERLLAIVGPCSADDPEAVLDYGHRLASLSHKIQDKILVVMRCYVEKPRTTTGWKGLVYDPDRNGQHDVVRGLEVSRRLMRDIVSQCQLPLATEVLSTLAVHYFSDLLCWAAVGARTTESQLHREMVSGLPMPVGFKNATNGDIAVALNAMKSASSPHALIGMNDDGGVSVLHTQGNPDTHIVLRGGRCSAGKHQPNYDALSLARCEQKHRQAGLSPRIVVDCSHENSGRNPANQCHVARSVVHEKVAGRKSVRGIMIESYIAPGAQTCQPPTYGQSVTDPCLGWEETEALMMALYKML